MITTEKFLWFCEDPITQLYWFFWGLWLVSGVRLSFRRGDFNMRDLTRGLEIWAWCTAALYGSWFIRNSPAILEVIPASLAAGFVVATVGGQILLAYRNVSLLLKRPPEERSLTAEPPPAVVTVDVPIAPVPVAEAPPKPMEG